jgi:hypothetical protein
MTLQTENREIRTTIILAMFPAGSLTRFARVSGIIDLGQNLTHE